MLCLHRGCAESYRCFPISILLYADAMFRIALSKRERELSSVFKPLALGQSSNEAAVPISANIATGVVSFVLPPTVNTDGVLRATVFKADSNEPLAERLVFRKPASQLNVKLSSDRDGQLVDSYTPGSKVTMTVTTTDMNGFPVSATVGVSVVDDTVIQVQSVRQIVALITA